MENNNIGNEKIYFGSPSAITVTDTGSPETFPPHWHNAAEFTIATKDGCKYRVGGRLFSLCAGDVLLVWPGQVHETVKIPPSSAIFIQFPSVIIDNNLDLVSISGLLRSFNLLPAKDFPETASFISEKIHEIQKIYVSDDPLSETKCKIFIYEILLKIGEHVLYHETKYDESGLLSGAVRGYIRAACSFIMANSSDDISQEDVSSHIGLSTYYFSRLFNQYMHMSFSSYLANLRVRNATNLLLNDELSITECAFMAGFQSTTSFNRVFHDVTGYSPREYKKMIIQEAYSKKKI
ncbi:MAG: helix-turn-helix transcriptional regulator [Lachnospiraceae bacterium]|jgi:AraC-like DNA-binding protein|nr:helix-turn-helix transcriptional regulator [Lachnospiraceae bacterium]MBQ3968461.1 helix-turn-helix transcriptional regulator [Lachnospiraceae bacterium]